MRYINNTVKEPPQEWKTKVEEVQHQIEQAANQEERNEIIDQNSKLWGKLKDWLLELSANKCWYSEAQDCYSHWEVEHYRPKKRAKNLDGTDREGYWWLAFDWKNFRICGNVGNRKKGAFFPLKDGTHIASSRNRNIDDEFPYLLDPTNQEDPLLLSFIEDGTAVVMPGITDEWKKSRVDVSIDRYKLNSHKPLVGARQSVWQLCRLKLNELQNLLKDNESASAKAKINDRMSQLREMVKENAPFSSVARECLLMSGIPWALRLVAG